MNRLNLGCGPKWREQYPDYAGLDQVDYGQKYVVNVLDFLCGGIPKVQFVNQFDEVMANHFLEHFNQNELKTIFSGVHQILVPGGVFRFTVPHMDKDRSWVLSHKTFWNEETVNWLSREDASTVYGFGSWKVHSIVTNSRKDIHAVITKDVASFTSRGGSPAKLINTKEGQ